MGDSRLSGRLWRIYSVVDLGLLSGNEGTRGLMAGESRGFHTMLAQRKQTSGERVIVLCVLAAAILAAGVLVIIAAVILWPWVAVL